MSALPLVETLRQAIAFEPLAEPAGNLVVGRGTLDGRMVRSAFVENRRASGALGALECERLAALFAVCVRERTGLVLFLDSAGAKISEGLAALGAFRKLYRAGLDAAFAGVPIAAVLGRNCYGGASMLAHLAPSRLFDPSTQLAMSGPSILATAAGTTALDEMFRAMADASLSPAARAKASSANRVWTSGEDPRAWLREALAPRGAAAASLRLRHEGLVTRLPQAKPTREEAVRRRDLEKIYAGGYEAREADGILAGSGRRGDAEETFVGAVGKSVLGAQRAWRFADAVWRLADAPPARLEVFLDCATHAARLDDERIVLTEFIVDMAFALAAAAAAGARVGLTVVGKAGGGVYVALAAPAARVASVYGAADIQVLPGTAVAAILGASREEAPSFEAYRNAGVADEELKLGFVPGSR